MVKEKKRFVKYYSNGMKYLLGHMKEAREVAIQAGLYRTWGNFGPLLKDNIGIPKKPIEIIKIEGWEFFIYEIEMMSMSWDFNLSKPRIEKVGYFRPARKKRVI